MDRGVTRREVLVRTGQAAGLGAAAIGLGVALHDRDDGVHSLKEDRQAKSYGVKDDVRLPQIAVASGEDPVKLVQAAVAAMGGMRRFVSRQDVVAIKPNIGWARVAAQAANTNPDIVAEVVRMCLDAGAKKVIVSDVSLNDPHRCFDLSGIRTAGEKVGAEVILPQQRKFRVHNMGGELLKLWPVYTTLLEADKVINLPIFKHHNLCDVTGAMKNWYGMLGGTRNQLHQNIHVSIADLATFMRPTITIMDAYRVIYRNGPQGGSVRDVVLKKQVIASLDQVAADAYGAVLLGYKPEDIRYLNLGEERGIGTKDWKKLRFKMVHVG